MYCMYGSCVTVGAFSISMQISGKALPAGISNQDVKRNDCHGTILTKQLSQ